MRFARWTFLIAGVYGLIVLAPIYFLEERIGRDDPPPITHPEYFYGFIGVALAWQVLFLLISRDPLRLRPAMLAAVIEKASYGIALIALFAESRVSTLTLSTGLVDLLLGLLFIIAFRATGRDKRSNEY